MSVKIVTDSTSDLSPELAKDLDIAYSTDYDSALLLRERLGSVFPEKRVYIEQIGAALGAHCGPRH